jgi:hypothetical protein
MKGQLALPLLLALAAPSPEIRYFQHERYVHVAADSQGQACLIVDTGLFAHAAPDLVDLRLYRNGSEEPYLIHQATQPRLDQQILSPMNAGTRGGRTVFDIEMPPGRYENIDLSVAAQDFVASVTVRGSQAESGVQTRVGSYTVFDLTHQKLGRGTMLALPISDYRYLHFDIAGPIKAESIQGIRVSRAIEEKPRYLEVVRTGHGTVHDRSTVLTVQVPANTPVDRIVFVPTSAAPELFERTVRITEKPARASSERPGREETVTEGSLLRIHGTRQGQRIDEERLEVAIPQRQTSEASLWTISIDNGDDRPLPIETARLEMVERDLCFDAQSGSSLDLYYGDHALNAPRYNYAALTEVQPHPAVAELGPEAANPIWQPRPDPRPFTERHPWLLWVALCVVIGLLAWLTMQTARRRIVST